jgi:hypothetical protein
VILAVWKNDVLGFYIELASVSLPAAGLALTMTILVFFCDGSWGAGGYGLVSSDGVKNSPPCKMVLIFCHFRHATCLLEGFSHCALIPAAATATLSDCVQLSAVRCEPEANLEAGSTLRKRLVTFRYNQDSESELLETAPRFFNCSARVRVSGPCVN